MRHQIQSLKRPHAGPTLLGAINGFTVQADGHFWRTHSLGNRTNFAQPIAANRTSISDLEIFKIGDGFHRFS